MEDASTSCRHYKKIPQAAGTEGREPPGRGRHASPSKTAAEGAEGPDEQGGESLSLKPARIERWSSSLRHQQAPWCQNEGKLLRLAESYGWPREFLKECTGRSSIRLECARCNLNVRALRRHPQEREGTIKELRARAPEPRHRDRDIDWKFARSSTRCRRASREAAIRQERNGRGELRLVIRSPRR